VLRAFYRKHYLPQHMKLVVVAPKPLADLEKDVRACFDGWAPPPAPPAPTTTAAAAAGAAAASSGGGAAGKKSSKSRKTASSQHSPHAHAAVPPLPSQEDCLLPFLDVNPFLRPPAKKKHDVGALGAVTRVVPVKKTHKLMMTWPLPSMTRTYRSKPAGYAPFPALLFILRVSCAGSDVCARLSPRAPSPPRRYVSHLLGHEGAGSLLSALKVTPPRRASTRPRAI